MTVELSLQIPFTLGGHTTFFEKSDAAPGEERRIAGIISTEARDRQNEVVVQKGLDFGPFLSNGWFNDNHSKATDGVVGVPTSVQQFQKGQRLPNGDKATHNCTWAEGYLLKGHPKADSLWALGESLAKAGGSRGLGFSIEGNVVRRSGPGNRTVAKATVTNCAVTNCPVNTGTKMEVLAKSIGAMEHGAPISELEPLAKALSMGAPPAGNASPSGAPVSGEGAGQVITGQSLESDVKPETEDKKKRKKNKLTKSSAYLKLRQGLPGHVTDETIMRIINLAEDMAHRREANNGAAHGA